MSKELNDMYKTADEVENINTSEDTTIPYILLGDEVHRTLVFANRLGMKYFGEPFYSITLNGYKRCKQDMEEVDRLLITHKLKPSFWQKLWHIITGGL